MQLLADAALHTELIGHAVPARPGRGRRGCGQLPTLHRRRAAASCSGWCSALHPDDLHEAGLVPSLRRLVGDLAPPARAKVVRARRGPPAARGRRGGALPDRPGGGDQRPGPRPRGRRRGGAALPAPAGGGGRPRRRRGLRRRRHRGAAGPQQGLGLVTMRQRAEIEDGQLEVRSVVGEGTEVRASFPRRTDASATSARRQVHQLVVALDVAVQRRLRPCRTGTPAARWRARCRTRRRAPARRSGSWR